MITSQQFADLFLDNADTRQRFIFNENDVIGFSVLEEYPENGLLFRPLRSQNNKVDTVALIEVFFATNRIDASGLAPIYIWIGPASKYLIGSKIRYDYSDNDSPSQEDLRKWNKVIKPAELQEHDYFFDTKTNKVLIKNKEKDPKTIIGEIFQKHIKTVRPISGIPFRFKLGTRNLVTDKPIYICKAIIWVCKVVFSRSVAKDVDTIAYELYLKPIPHRLFVISQQRELSILGTELPVSKHSVTITAFLFFCTYLISNYWLPDLQARIDQATTNNTLLAGSAVIIWFVIFNNWIPHILLSISNGIVITTTKFRNWKIRV